MHEIGACAACLATDVRMFSLGSGGLLQAYELISGRQCNNLMLQQLCWECAALVNKFNIFRQKCERAYLLLHNICSQQNNLSEEQLRHIDRKSFNLTSTYGFSEPHKYNIVNRNSKHPVDCLTSAESNDYSVDLPKAETENLELKGGEACIDIKSEIDQDSDNDIPLLYLSDEMKFNERRRKFNQKARKDCNIVVEDTASVVKDSIDLDHCDGKDVDIKIEMSLPESEAQIDTNSVQTDTVQTAHKINKYQSNKNIQPDVRNDKRLKLKRWRSPQERRDGEKAVKERNAKKTLRNKRQDTTEVQQEKVNFTDFATAVILTQEQQMEEISRRQDTASYREAVFKCTLCFKGFVGQQSYDNHMRKHDPATGEYQCDMCKSRFKKRYYVADHIYKVHMTKYFCKFCPFISQCLYQASTHYKWHKGVVYTCSVCREEFTTKSTYLSHRRIKHATEHACGVCGESFVSRLGLQQHSSRLHKDAPAPDGRGPHCADCDVRFSCEQAWNKHLMISPRHAGDARVRNGCRDCGVCFASERELRAHRSSQHRRQKIKEPAESDAHADGYPVKCSQCEQVVENARRYWQHFRREHPAEQYPSFNSEICEYCGKGFKCKSVLAHHRNMHTGKRSYACSLCPKTFFTPQNLDSHLKSHSDSRPYVCDVCSKGFKFSVALLRHRRIHTGERPYPCHVCGKAFTDSSGRKVHVRTVHLKEPTPYVSKARLERKRESEAAKSNFSTAT